LNCDVIIPFIFVLNIQLKAMNYIDIIIILILIGSAIGGAQKGFIYEVASLIALIGGVWGAIRFSHATETFLVQRMDIQNNYINIIAFVITFIIIIVLVHLLAKAVEKAFETFSLGGVNRILGLVFSVFKSLFILGILVIIIDKIDETLPFIPEKAVQESRFYKPLSLMTIKTFPFIQGLMEDLKDEEPEDEKPVAML
jgi:membrane protein required for colicin V production